MNCSYLDLIAFMPNLNAWNLRNWLGIFWDSLLTFCQKLSSVSFNQQSRRLIFLKILSFHSHMTLNGDFCILFPTIYSLTFICVELSKDEGYVNLECKASLLRTQSTLIIFNNHMAYQKIAKMLKFFETWFDAPSNPKLGIINKCKIGVISGDSCQNWFLHSLQSFRYDLLLA